MRMEMARLFVAYCFTTFLPHDETYAHAFTVDPVEAGVDEEKAAAGEAQRGINTYMLNRSNCDIGSIVIVVSVYPNLMYKWCYFTCRV
jgi:hypothetical protein